MQLYEVFCILKKVVMLTVTVDQVRVRLWFSPFWHSLALMTVMHSGEEPFALNWGSSLLRNNLFQ